MNALSILNTKKNKFDHFLNVLIKDYSKIGCNIIIRSYSEHRRKKSQEDITVLKS